MSAEAELLSDPEPALIRNGRYHIDDKTWARASGVSGSITDEYALTNWKRRLVASGVANNEDLALRIAALGDTEADQEAKTEATKLCDDAARMAGSEVSANIGTALHAFIALGDRDRVPPRWHGHLDAYEAGIAGLGLEVIPGMVERTCTLSALDENIAGTFDMLFKVPGRALPVVGDIKSGRADFGSDEWAIQLAIYAHAEQLYDKATREVSPKLAVDQDIALIVHLPAKADPPVCTVYELDIAAGWEAAKLAVQVRAWRKRKGLLTPISDKPSSASSDGPAAPVAPTGAAAALTDSAPAMVGRIRAVRDNLKGRIDGLDDTMRGQVAARWPADVPTLKDEFLGEHTLDTLAQVEAVIDQVDAEHAAPFPDEPNPELVPLPGDHPQIVDAIRRCQDLPSDIVALLVDAVRAAGANPGLSQGTTTPGQLAIVEELLITAEAAAEVRRERVRGALEVLAAHGIDQPAVAVAVGHDTGRIDVTDWQAARIEDLADSADLLVRDIGGDAGIACKAPELIVERYPNRRAMWTHAKQLAKQIDRPVPAKADDVFADILLVAAIAVADVEPQPTNPQAANQGAAA